MTRPPIRVPGFPEPPSNSQPPSEPSRSPSRARPPAPAAPPPTPVPVLDRRAGVRQLNVRVLIPLLQRYQRLLRTLEDEGFDTSMAELTQALLHHGPETPHDAKQVVRAWRRALDPDDA